MTIMSWITFWIAVAGFLMSAVTWIRDFWMRRNSIELTVLDYTQRSGGILQFFLLFQNKSTVPASVSKLLALCGDNWYACELEPKMIKKTPSGYEVKTPCFPLSLPPSAFTSAYFEFLKTKDSGLAPGTTVSFQIHTSRGTLTKSITLGDTGHYLHSR